MSSDDQLFLTKMDDNKYLVQYAMGEAPPHKLQTFNSVEDALAYVEEWEINNPTEYGLAFSGFKKATGKE